MLLKKVEVVVDAMTIIPTSKGDPFQTSQGHEIFNGKNLEVVNRAEAASSSDVLVVKDGADVLAVFRVWNYWRKIE